MIDIVIPNGNEEEFIITGKKLGYSGLIMLYQPKEFSEKLTAFEEMKKKNEGFALKIGLLIDATKAKSIHSYRDAIRNAEFIAGRGFSPSLFEEKGINVIFGLEEQKKDFSTFRNSGLNQVLSLLAKKNRTAVGISFSEIAESSEKKTEIIARAIQNISLCEKYSVGIIAASFAAVPELMRNPRDIKSLLLMLGMNEQVSGHVFLSNN
jgi:RNase P/RNase MRP subunit p30